MREPGCTSPPKDISSTPPPPGVVANQSAGRFKILAALRTCRARLLFVKCRGMTVVPVLGAFHDCICICSIYVLLINCERQSCFENRFVSDL